MSIRTKILLLLAFVFIAYLGTARAVQRLVVFPSFASLERDEATMDQHRCTEAIQREVELLSYALSDWSSWDDTYQFIVDENEAYKTSNLIPTMFSNNKLNLVCFLDLDNRIVWLDARDLATMEPLSFKAFAGPSMDLKNPLLNIKELTGAVEGVMLTEHGPMLVVSRRILHTNNDGPMRGTMIRGRLLDEGQIKSIAERTHVDMNLLRIPGQTLSPEAASAMQELSSGAPLSIREIDEGKALQVSSVMNGIDGSPALLMTSRIPRGISARGRTAMNIALASDLAAGLAILLLMWAALRRIVIGPLSRLTSHAIVVGKSDDLSKPIAMNRRDEVGTLADEFDHMMKSLAESRARLLDTAHRAGMAEIATGVIHNVGNVLNSVNVSARRAAETVNALDVADLNGAIGLMREHADDLASFISADEKGKLIPTFLAQLGEQMAADQQTAIAELETLTKHVAHVAEIVNTQQSYAHVTKAITRMSIVDLVEDALRINAAAMERHKVRVVREYEDKPSMMLDRHKVMQILVNLLSNAKYAFDGCPESDRQIRVRISKPPSAQPCVRIEVSDNGAGISKEHMPKLFTHGFTTRKEGHGFGLHNSANAAKSLGGRLHAKSDGPGKGAMFALEIPLHVRETVA